VAILELLREGLIDIVQTEQLAPLHVRRVPPVRTLQLVPGVDQQEAPSST
jgi:chromatin segregation and condensation protein Rec8/ScpA/Scc1 (kleisin family)